MELIDCRYVSLERFAEERGYQPMDSLFYLTEGCFEFEMGGVRERAEANELVLFPDDVYFTRSIKKPISFYYVRFERGDMPLTAGKLNVTEHRRMITTLKYLTELTRTPTADRDTKNHFLRDIFYQVSVDSATHFDPLVSEIQYFIHKNADSSIDLETLASRAGVSVPTLITRFKNAVGTTPIDYLIRVRIQNSETLLCGSALPISEIATLCGFESAYYFSNTFKKHIGMSPREYRKKGL